MTDSKRFCAREGERLGDPLAGSGKHAAQNLLISWPRAKWVRSLRQASDMSDDVLAALAEIASAGRRVNLIHRRGQATHRHLIVFMPECARYEVERAQLPQFLDAMRQGQSIERWHSGRVDGSMILCCTHGRKDKCCAKFGFRAYQALARAAQHHAGCFDVWESTHLGGCRFAATAIVFPKLRKYGRISAEHATPLLDAEARNRVYLPCYRGDSTLTPCQQCAQVTALGWLEERGLSATVFIEDDPDRIDADHRRVVVRWTTNDNKEGRLEVTCRASELLRYDTCEDFESATAKPSTIWQVSGVVSCNSDTRSRIAIP